MAHKTYPNHWSIVVGNKCIQICNIYTFDKEKNVKILALLDCWRCRKKRFSGVSDFLGESWVPTISRDLKKEKSALDLTYCHLVLPLLLRVPPLPHIHPLQPAWTNVNVLSFPTYPIKDLYDALLTKKAL